MDVRSWQTSVLQFYKINTPTDYWCVIVIVRHKLLNSKDKICNDLLNGCICIPVRHLIISL